MKRLFLSFVFVFIGLVLRAADYPINRFGAKPGVNQNSTRAIQRAIDECSRKGGRVIFPAGVWCSSTIYMKSNVTIVLEENAVWQGLADSTAYPYIPPEIPSRMSKPWKAFVYGYGLENIGIEGRGIFYPGGDMDCFQDGITDSPARPYGIHLVNCKNIRISGIYMKNSAFWMQRYFCCDNVYIEGIEVFNHANHNNDGIDLDGCHTVRISNCIIDSSDDGIVLKSEGYRSCRDVVITNCILSSFATPLKLGTGSVGGFERIAVSNLIIRPSKAREMHHGLKSWRGLSGIDILCVDGGIMEDVSISNVLIDSSETAFMIKLGNRNSGRRDDDKAARGIARNIRLSNISATNCGPIASIIDGCEGNRVEEVYLDNIRIQVEGNPDMADTTLTVRENSGGYPYNRMYGSKLPAYGLFVRHVEGLYVRDLHLSIKNTDVRSAVVVVKSSRVVIDGLSADKPASGLPVVQSSGCNDLIIKDKQ